MQQQIQHLVLPNSGQQFNSNDFNQLCSPGVYVLTKGEQILYVGMGKNVLRRLSGLHHKRHLFAECDKILIYPCVSANAAYELEAILIDGLRPLHNNRRKYAALGKRLGIHRPDSLKRYK